MDPAVARALSLLQFQIKNLEKRVCWTENHTDDDKDYDLPGRYANMFQDIEIDPQVIAGSPLLVNLYQSETLKLTPQCVGTWPDDNAQNRALCIFGGDMLAGYPCEEIRLCIIPQLISHQVPFSCTQIDSTEKLSIEAISDLLKAAPSHLIIDSVGSFNFPNRILESYLLGRGHGHIYRIKREPPEARENVENIIQAQLKFSHLERHFECSRILAALRNELDGQPLPKLDFDTFIGEKDAFYTEILDAMPDILQKHRPQTVAERRSHWNLLCDDEPIATDMGNLVAAAFVAGMMSPKARGNYSPVPRDAIAGANEWCGKIKMYCHLARVLRPQETGQPNNDLLDALSFFAALLQADMKSA